ncbi:MAG: phosphatase PAP2 family protein [Bacteroidaceae bacterium]|nr:phosphatase PAP2 family protein [Bacteroidaceae bacterium]
MRQVLLLWLCWVGALAAMCAQGVDSPRVAARVDGADGVLDSVYLAQIDSVMQLYEQMERQRQVEQVIHRFEEQRLKKEMSMDFSGVLPLARGMLLTWTDHNFMTHPAQFESKGDRCNWIDYGVAATPLLANWVMKAAGVKSRSKLERMLTANAMALGLSFGVTELLKSTVNETRPDLSDNQSFSSGHASFAFVAATVLHREYGHISPWISVGGYTAATTTQLLRIQHNKHWMNDLYMGAGIGTVSTNLAYFLTDKIFGVGAINKPKLRFNDVQRLMQFNMQPTGYSFVAGTEIGNRMVHFDDATMKSGAAIAVGADLSWHTSPYLSLELMARAVDAQMKVYGQERLFTGGILNIYHFDVGAKFSAPISLGTRVGTRVFAGTRIMDGITLTDGVKSYTIPNETKFECGMGVSYECLDTDNYAWGVIADYYHTFSHYMPNRYSISSTWKILF